jgi:hypothetical protein
MKPHKHAEAIKAWADGETIEMFTADGCWMEVTHPSWMRDMEYRIRKEPKPDIVIEHLVFYNKAISSDANLRDFSVQRWLDDGSHYGLLGKFKITFDGETGEVKSAEVVK